MTKLQQKLLGFFFMLLLAVLPSCTAAQAYPDMLESRVSRLEADNYQLQSRINQLESQISGLSQLPSRNSGSIRQAPQVSPRLGRGALSGDPMFDRLATLVIELKERVYKLEAQVVQLQKKGS